MLETIQQAGRELLLLESSDWPFLVTTGQAREYAIGRFQHHVARYNKLIAVIESGKIDAEDERFLSMVEDLDNPFRNIDYTVFREQEIETDGSAALTQVAP